MYLTIFRKGLLLVAVPLLFQLVFIGLMARGLHDAAEAERVALHTKGVIVEAEAAYGQFLLAQAASRGHVISGSPVFKAQLAAARQEAMGRMAALERLVANNPAQADRVRRARELANRVVAWQTETVGLVAAGRRQEATDRVTSLEGKRRLDALRAAIDEFLAIEQQSDAEQMAQLRTARASQYWALGGGLFGATLVTGFVAWLFGRGIAYRLAVVTRNAERLADSQPLADPLPGRDEIARLDAVMHETARRLAAAGQTARAYKQELEGRAGELAAANESLRQQTQENEMFVYSVSHDLRSPLVNLQGFSNELTHAGADLRRAVDDARVPPDVRQRVGQVLDLDVADSVKFIKSAVTRSAAIIDALLRLSRAGRVEYRPQSVDVAAVVRRVIDAMANTIQAKRAEVVVAGPLPECWGDPTAVEQVFGNLIGNAVNYLDPGRPGRVEIGVVDAGSADAAGAGDGKTADGGVADDKVADGKVADDGGRRTYYVRDNGLGIPAAYLGKVFVAFQRLHGEVAKGEGIGLALVRRAVERHNGKIWVTSTEGIGTTFYVALPARDPAAAAQRPAPEPPAATIEPAGVEPVGVGGPETSATGSAGA